MLNLGHGRNSGVSPAAGESLLDGDRRRQAGHEVDVRLVEDTDVLARVGRQAFEKSSLSFGEDDVEREAALPRSRQAGHDDELVPRDVDVDVSQVVLASAANRDMVPTLAGSLEGCGRESRRFFSGMDRGNFRCTNGARRRPPREAPKR